MEACILTGGRCRRMGQEKPLIRDGAVSIVEKTIQKLGSLTDHVYLICNSDNFHQYINFVSDKISVVQDEIEDIGPLGGIHAGLTKMKGETSFFIAGDMPFIEPDLLERLKFAYQEDPEYDAVVCKTDSGIEPLVAVYSKKILPFLIKNVEECRLSVMDLLKNVKTKYCSFISESNQFISLNVPEDLKKLSK